MAKKEKKNAKEDYSSAQDENLLLNLGVLLFNLMALNILWFICSLPIVTMGAATTAMNYTCLKLRNDEGDSVIRMFFKSFGQNIRQATIINTVLLAIMIILFAGLIQMAGGASQGNLFSTFIMVIIILTIFVWLLVYVFIFFVLAKFDNTLVRTVTNSLYFMYNNRTLTLRIFFTLFFMLVTIPIALWYVFPYGFPMFIFFGIPATAYFEAKHFNELFDKYVTKKR